jgi:hypothetical protein
LGQPNGLSDDRHKISANVAVKSKVAIKRHPAKTVANRFVSDLGRGATRGGQPSLAVPNQNDPKAKSSADHAPSHESNCAVQREFPNTRPTTDAEISNRYAACLRFRITTNGPSKEIKNRESKATTNKLSEWVSPPSGAGLKAMTGKARQKPVIAVETRKKCPARRRSRSAIDEAMKKTSA